MKSWTAAAIPPGCPESGIPLHARIVGAVDAFDTFTSERYFYADPLSAHQALTFLGEEMSGLVRSGSNHPVR